MFHSKACLASSRPATSCGSLRATSRSRSRASRGRATPLTSRTPVIACHGCRTAGRSRPRGTRMVSRGGDSPAVLHLVAVVARRGRLGASGHPLARIAMCCADTGYHRRRAVAAFHAMVMQDPSDTLGAIEVAISRGCTLLRCRRALRVNGHGRQAEEGRDQESCGSHIFLQQEGRRPRSPARASFDAAPGGRRAGISCRRRPAWSCGASRGAPSRCRS